ncbi:MAG: hypothetical protein WBE26_08705 [Phycisphaerae bacterium]
MKFVSGLLGICFVVVVNCAAAQPDGEAGKAWREDRLRRGVSPQRVESDRLPALEHNIEVVMRAAITRIAAYEPLIVNVTLTNRDVVPLDLEARDDGLPYGTASVVTRRGGAAVRRNQWLEHYESAPGAHQITLAPGESTTGELLIMLGSRPTGIAFPVPGTYTVQCACQPDGRFAPVMSNEIRVSVDKLSEQEKSFFSDLRRVSIGYYGVNEDWLIQKEGEEVRKREFGLKILRRLLRHTKPLLIEPKRNPQHKKPAELVTSLEALLERYPDSAYSGYIARYLGLVYVATLEHEASLGGWGERDPERARAHPAYAKALRYLTMAKDANLWPRTTALENLVLLHILAQQWDKAAEYLVALRERCADIGGVGIADKLEAEMQRFRGKIEAHKAKESPGP